MTSKNKVSVGFDVQTKNPANVPFVRSTPKVPLPLKARRSAPNCTRYTLPVDVEPRTRDGTPDFNSPATLFSQFTHRGVVDHRHAPHSKSHLTTAQFMTDSVLPKHANAILFPD